MSRKIFSNSDPAPSIAFLKKKTRSLFFCGFIFMLFSPVLASGSEPVLKTLSARVVKVENAATLQADFKHPVTEEILHLVFLVDAHTGFSKMKGLQSLREGDIVNIDYVEDDEGHLLIRRIAKMKLSGPPPGVEKFHGF